MTNAQILTGVAVVMCVALSFLFSGMETGVLALNRFRIRQRMTAGDRSAAVLHGFLDNPENFLFTILVGNTVVNFAIFSLATIEFYDWLRARPWLWMVAFVLAVFVFYILCELAPKTLFQRYPNRLSLALARPFRVIHRILAPLVAVAGWFSNGLLYLTGGRAFTGRLFGSREELRFIMQESAPGLTSEEKIMINRVLDLQNLRVRHVMIPLANAVAVSAAMPLGKVLEICRKENLTRVPVADAGTNRIAGIINLERTLYQSDLDPARPAREYSQAAFFLAEELRLEDALRRMQNSGARLAVVLGPNHQETGIISLQDILTVIFGEVTL